MDLTVAGEIGAEEETGKVEETGREAEIGTAGILVGIIIVIITGMEVDGVIHIATGMVTSTTLVTVESIVTRVNGIIAIVSKMIQEDIRLGESVTTRL